MLIYLLLICTLTLCFAVVATAKPLSTDRTPLTIRWRVVPYATAAVEAPFVAEILLKNIGIRELGNRGWRLHFNFCRELSSPGPHDGVRFVHVNGDHYYLEPTSDFAPFRQGTERAIRFETRLPLIKETDGPSGFFLVLKDELREGQRVIALGEPTFDAIDIKRQTKRSRDDLVSVPDAKFRYEENLELESAVKTKPGILPTPISFVNGAGAALIKRNTAIVADETLAGEALYLAESLEPLLGIKLTVKKPQEARSGNAILLSLADVEIGDVRYESGATAYRLSVANAGDISIQGTDAAGVFYGIQSLRALLLVESYHQVQDSLAVAAAEIQDAPEFAYRGMHLDVARNFQELSTVKKFLELMAFYKLNKFHFHLTDDEGWRLEIEGLPELTEIGGKRLFTESGEEGLMPSFGSGPSAEAPDSYGSGFYTRQEFIELLQYAAQRHIEVIPEIDLPGHSRAAIRAMDVRYRRLMADGQEEQAREYLLHDFDDTSRYESVQLWNDNVVNVCQPSAHAFVMHVLEDVRAMYVEAGLELRTIHLGGDEVPEGVWEGTRCQDSEQGKLISRKEAMANFFHRLAESFSLKNGVVLGAWEEVFLNDLRKSQVVADSTRKSFTGPDYLCYVWNNVWGWGQEDVAYRLANSGVNVVLCNATHLYFDLAYNKAPWEPGYYWAGFVETKTPYSFAPLNYLSKTRKDIFGHDISEENIKRRERLTDKGKKHVVGVQGQLWGENLKGAGRLEYMALPKLIALAERAWAQEPAWISDENPETWPQKLQQAWSEFASQLGGRELPRLDYMLGGFRYRIPEPGAVIEQGMLKANVEFPGLAIRYTTDGSEPDINSLLYTAPVHVGTSARVRVFSSNGREGRSVAVKETSPHLN